MLSRFQSSNLWRARHWLILAAAIRVIAAFTRVNWHYPDEWYQTIEFSRLILDGTATYTHEIALHLRNLSWPLVLCAPLWIADRFAPHWTHFRLIAAQLLAGGLDFAAVCAFAWLARRWKPFWLGLGLALLVLPWFRVQDSVSLGAEHISVCLIWIAIALLSAGRWRSAGLTAMAIFAVKYPAGLVTAGFGVALFLRCLKTREWKPFSGFMQGAFLGLVLFGLPDWIFYGRPWESVWMYLQYNVFTGAGVQDFGRQGLSAYGEFFSSRWLHVLFPIGLAFLAAGIMALRRGFRGMEPWAWAFAFYFAGHLFVAHREPRFMFPAEALLLWGALEYASERWGDPFSVPRVRKWVAVALIAVFALNLPLFLKASLAETGTLNSSYFKIDDRLRDNPSSCAVISQRRMESLVIPSEFLRAGKAPSIGFFDAQRRIPTFPQASSRTLAWYVNAPSCTAAENVLLLVDHPDVTWVEKGCKLQQSGLLSILPQSLWVAALRRGWVSGPWYVCPASVISEFKKQATEDPFVHSFSRFSELPPYGLTPRELDQFRARFSTPPQCRWTCT